MPNQLHYRTCNLCEAMCGLEIEHDGERVIRVSGDKKDPFSEGYICPKGANYGSLHHDPNRLKKPLKRVGESFVEISFAEAFAEIGEQLNRIRKEHGNNAVSTYLGNPSVHNYGVLLLISDLKKALGSKHAYSATSVDQLPHHLAAHYLFGHSLRIPIPDINRTDLMIIMGGNPAVSNGSLMSVAGVEKKLRAIQERGGQYVVIDPRFTETAKGADAHHFIRPGTDVYFLLSMLHVVVTENLVQTGHLTQHLKGLEAINAAVLPFTPAATEPLTGVSAAVLTALARKFATTQRAVLYGRMGLSTQAHGGLCNWLISVLNTCTGHLDSVGGAMFNEPAVAVVRSKTMKNKHGRWHSNVRGLPEFEGELPVATMAEDMLAEGPGKIRALITNAGNPVLSTPNGQQLERALTGLDYMVCIDIYLNETTRHANIILPPAFGLENDHYDLVFNALAVRNVAKYAPALFQPAAGAYYDWQILKELTAQLSLKPLSRFYRWSTPSRLLRLALLSGPYGRFNKWGNLFAGLSLGKLKRNPHGIDLGPLRPMLPAALLTPDRKIDLYPAYFGDELQKLTSQFTQTLPVPPTDELLLIGRRSLKSNNSWMHNVPKLMAGANRCVAHLHPSDGLRFGIKDGEQISVASRVGSIELPVLLTETIMPGVISIPHGYGHHGKNTRLDVANIKGGVSINDLTDDQLIDELTGNAAFSGVKVRVSLPENQTS